MVAPVRRFVGQILQSGTVQQVIDKHLGRIIRNSGWSLVATLGSSVFGLVQTILLGRLLGADSFGVLATIIAYVTIVNQFVDFRVWEVTTKYLSDYWIQGKREHVVAIVKLSYSVDLLSGIVAFMMVILGLPVVSRFVFPEPIGNDLVVLFALGLLFATVDGTGQAILRVFDRFKELSLWQIGASLVRLVSVIGVLLARWGLQGVLFAYLVSACVGALGLLYLVSRILTAVVGELKGNMSLIREKYGQLARFLFHTNMSTFWSAINRNLDVIILGHFWGTAEVGYFKMAKVFVSRLALMTDPFYRVLFPELSKLWAQGNVPAYNQFLRRISLVSATSVILMALVVTVAAPWIVSLTVGEEYLPAVRAIRIMVWGIVIAVTFVWARPTVVAIGRPEIGNVAGAVNTALYVAISLLIVPSWGYLGTATVFLLPYISGHIIVIGAYLLYLRNRQGAHRPIGGAG